MLFLKKERKSTDPKHVNGSVLNDVSFQHTVYIYLDVSF